jgi:hypothetical protein
MTALVETIYDRQEGHGINCQSSVTDVTRALQRLLGEAFSHITFHAYLVDHTLASRRGSFSTDLYGRRLGEGMQAMQGFQLSWRTEGSRVDV